MAGDAVAGDTVLLGAQMGECWYIALFWARQAAVPCVLPSGRLFLPQEPLWGEEPDIPVFKVRCCFFGELDGQGGG